MVFYVIGMKMCSRYNKDFFPQHSLMHIPFLHLNEIIHPNAEEIPDHIRHCNNTFWCNNMEIHSEMEMEGRKDEYVQTYISYLNALRANYDRYAKVFFFFYLLQYRLFELASNFLVLKDLSFLCFNQNIKILVIKFTIS